MTDDTMPKRVVSFDAAAAYAGVSRWTLHNWLTYGGLRYCAGMTEEGRSVGMIDLSDVDALLERLDDGNE